MNSTALRSIRKIRSKIFRNPRRLFSFKFEITPASHKFQENPEEGAFVEQAEEPENANFRYNVCQPRTSPVERPSNVGDVVVSQKNSVKQAIEQQNLQPSMLPEYYQKQMEKSVLVSPEPSPNEGNSNNKLKQRRFQESKTRANAILPLKSVKLANPFPEPVKMMMSRTVSDDEKAEQMLAEARSQRNMPQGSRNLYTEVKRWYSSKSKDSSGSSSSKKCPKFGQMTQKGTCPRMTLKGCPPRARTKCDRLARDIECKKQEAPYPAYSEFCHEELEEKPSECKLCPWSAEDNPNFKPQTKKMHTSSSLGVRRSGLEMDWNQYPRDQQTREMGEKEAIEPVENIEESNEGMLCDLRKPPCERPKNLRCPPKKEKKKKKKPKKEEKECANQALEEDEDLLLDPLEPTGRIMSLKHGKDKSKSKKKDKKAPGGKCKVRKFKFPQCKNDRKKEEEKKDDPCAKKKKKRKIIDCPPADDEKGCSPGISQIVQEYQFSQKKDEKKKCPKIDQTIDESVMDKEPCVVRRGTTRICPGDLLKKKRRKPNKKQASEDVIPPVDEAPKKEPPQPTIRTS